MVNNNRKYIFFTTLRLLCINILTITTKTTQCPRGEIGRHKGLKILALLGVPVRVWPRAPYKK